MAALLLSLSILLQTDTTTARLYAVVLDSFFVHPGIGRLFVRPYTVTGVGHIDETDFANGLKGLGILPDGLRDDFARHRSERQLIPAIPTRVPTIIFTDSLAAGLPHSDPDAYWRAFRQRFPDATSVIALSPVGFSADHTAAIVMVDFGCGGLCGGTIYYLVELRQGRWVVTRKAQVRVS
jgi:hypothetical protein